MDNTAAPMLLDAYGLRVFGFIAAYIKNGPQIIARGLVALASEVAVSAEVAHHFSGMSTKALRGAVKRGELPSIGSRSHRYIPLPALLRRGLTLDGVAAALDNLRDLGSLDELRIAAPVPEGPFVDDGAVLEPEALPRLLQVRGEQLAAGL
jgi:hypothetical protein